MTSQLLTSELNNLIQEAKRKSSEVKNSAEASLAEIRTLTSRSENEIGQDLANKSQFLTPFLQACKTHNVKLTTIAITCLQRLVLAKGLAKTRLKEVLEAFREASNLGVDIQLKILQALPSLLQNYAAELQGDLLIEALHICSILQSSKNGIINNTAAATLQQLVVSVFDKVVAEDDKALETPATTQIVLGDDKLLVRQAALDAYHVFSDLCLLTEGQRPHFIKTMELANTFGLELVESVLTNHAEIFLSHPEQAYILRLRVMPFLIRSLSDNLNFATTVRVMRVLYIILRRHLLILEKESEVALGLLIHMLDPDATVPWKRALCLEVIRGVFAEASLVRSLFALFDGQEGHRPLIKELTSSLARLATEKPNVIGLGTQSSVSFGQGSSLNEISSEQAALEAGGLAGVIGGAVGLAESNVAGLSMQWSTIRVPCIEQLDKTNPPVLPESYVYFMTLTCINSFSEGLAKFILPFALGSEKSKSTRAKKSKGSQTRLELEPNNSGTDTPRGVSPRPGSSPRKNTQGQKYYLPVNPLALENHPARQDIVTSAVMVESCWPALLACYSTYLYATLDTELYHGLVRSLQKFSQVAGLLGLSTPRDAFLTTLGKAAVPSHIFSAHLASSSNGPQDNQGLLSNTKGLLSVDSLASPLSSLSERSFSFSGASSLQDSGPPQLNTRHLICLRALLNLGTALGSTLHDSWSIILETLQQADFILFSSSRRSGRSSTLSSNQRSGNEAQLGLNNVSSEIVAVESTVTRMFQSTKEYPNDAFINTLLVLCKHLGMAPDVGGKSTFQTANTTTNTEAPPSRSPISPNIVRRGSVMHPQSSGVSASTEEQLFVLTKLGEVAQINIDRLIAPQPSCSGWDVLLKHLTMFVSSRSTTSLLRLRAADVLHDLVIAIAKSLSSTTKIENIAEVQERILMSIHQEIYDLTELDLQSTGDVAQRVVEADIHKIALETLYRILELSGESLVAGWDILFNIIQSAFNAHDEDRGNLDDRIQMIPVHARSSKLIKASFLSLQLICSDFLSVLPLNSILVLIDTLFSFSRQTEDLNISLTTITFFWNVSDFLQTRKGDDVSDFDLPDEEAVLLQLVQDGFPRTDPYMASWMVLLLRLAEVTKEERPEVRNGSIQTLFRIFDTYGHRLGPRAWDCCLKIVIFRMMKVDSLMVDHFNTKDDHKQWAESLILIVMGIGTVYANYFNTFVHQDGFEKTWAAFLAFVRSLIRLQSIEINAVLFKEITKILERAQDLQLPDTQCQDQAWEVWQSHGIDLVQHSSEETKGGMQETLIAYVETFHPLYKLLEAKLDITIIETATTRLRECMTYPDAPAYFSDLDVLTPLQTSIMDCLKLIRTDIDGVPSLLLKDLAMYTRLPYTSENMKKTTKSRRPTYVALSSAAIRFIEDIISKHTSTLPGIYDDGALADVLEAISIHINLKYQSKAASLRSTKRQPLWMQASQSALKILGLVMPVIDNANISKEHEILIWKHVVGILQGIISETSNESTTQGHEDEKHDILAYTKMRSMIIPRVGKEGLPGELIEGLIQGLYQSSLLYIVPASFSFTSSPLVSSSTPLNGSTSDLTFVIRSNMSYLCIDELFALVKAESQGDEYARIASITMPVLLYRIGLVLRRYIADQPIRGRMPQTRCQQKELLYLLKELVNLKLPRDRLAFLSIPGDHGLKTQFLHLFGLLSQTIAVARNDDDLLKWLSQAMTELEKLLEV